MSVVADIGSIASAITASARSDEVRRIGQHGAGLS
jgi:hypothetical protein